MSLVDTTADVSRPFFVDPLAPEPPPFIKRPSEASGISNTQPQSVSTQIDIESHSKDVRPLKSPPRHILRGNLETEFQPANRRRERRRGLPAESSAAEGERLWLLNRWQGQVLKVDRDSFEAQLTDLSQPSIIELAEFPRTAVASDQISLIRPGALFYWFIGYRDSARGRNHVSQIWMRRGGRMTEDRYEMEKSKLENIWKTLEF
jgi:hypothetical protein